LISPDLSFTQAWTLEAAAADPLNRAAADKAPATKRPNPARKPTLDAKFVLAPFFQSSLG